MKPIKIDQPVISDSVIDAILDVKNAHRIFKSMHVYFSNYITIRTTIQHDAIATLNPTHHWI